MLRAAAIALPLLLCEPLASPGPQLLDTVPLPPFDGVQPGFWGKFLRGLEGVR